MARTPETPEMPVTERLRSLRARSGLSMRAIAGALGYAGGSSYQRYEDPALFAERTLPLWLVRRLVPALEGRGVPPIAPAEIYALAGVLPPQGGAPRVAAAPPAAPSSLPPFATMPRDVPVHGTVVGGAEGDFEMNGAIVDYVRRPPGIAGTRDVFALYVTGDSMEPRYRPGDLVYVNPTRPPRAGDDVVVELLPAGGREDGAGPAFVKTLRARAAAAWICEQYNPPRQLEYPLARVRQVLRIMTLTELLGA